MELTRHGLRSYQVRLSETPPWPGARRVRLERISRAERREAVRGRSPESLPRWAQLGPLLRSPAWRFLVGELLLR